MEEGSTFSERLALLPKINTEERTLVHVQGQKSYAKSYASEGRTYMLSWRDERQSDAPLSGEDEKHLADIDLGTPILKPRVEKLAKPAILARSPKIDGGNENTKIVNTVISIKSSNSDKNSHQQRIARKDKKIKDTTNKVDKRKGKSMSSQKKRVNESPSDSSSRLERLKERREKKRAKRVIVEVPKSDKENGAEESRETRKKSKKIPAGFALMHGFTTTNVGKGRLTVNPPATIGVFNKGKASRRTSTVKGKGSGKNNQRKGCFSESKFLNKSKREDGPPDRSSSGSSDTSVTSGGIVVRVPSKRKKVMESVPSPSEVKSTASPKAPSIIRDITHDNANPCSASVASHKQGSVFLDTTRHVWANAMCKSDAEKKGTAIRSQEKCETIGPSQSASQCIIVPPEKLDGNRSKYFLSRVQPTRQAQDMTQELLVSLCSFQDESSDDVARMSMEDQIEKVILPENACTQNVQVSQPLQRELAYDEVKPADVTHDSAQEFAQRELDYDEHMPIDPHLLQPDALDGDTSDRWVGYLPCSEFGDLENHEHHQDLHNDILDQNRSNDAFFIDENSDAAGEQMLEEDNTAPDDFHEFTAEGDPCRGHFNNDGEFYDYCQAEGVPNEEPIVLDRDSSSIGEADASSSEELNSFQVDQFYQGRAMLLGCTVHESGGQRRVASNYLASAEVDVVKRLRDHWHPRRL
ncbi:hypothetical protein APHAL10511_001798 [Amanita phalloides]|nr:hypothetical protein APHAL10511_001798 [Amanita phalloides]